MIGQGSPMSSMPSSRYVAACDIFDERERQEDLKAAGRFRFTCADVDSDLTLSDKLAILLEELGEVAKEVLTQDKHRLARDTEGTTQSLYRELVQVGAVTLAWLEGMNEEVN